MSATELVLRSSVAGATGRLHRSSSFVAQQHYNLALKCKWSSHRLIVASLLEVLLAAPRGGTRRHLEEGCELRAASAPSQQAAASAPSQQQQQQATVVSRDDERSTRAFLLEFSPPDDRRTNFL